MSYWYRGQWHDEATLHLAYDDPGLIYGASVFTTCRVYGKSIDHPLSLWPLHQQRLQNSLVAWGWTMPDWTAVRQGMQLIQQPVVRVTIFPDGRELIFGRDLPVDLGQRQTQGITAKVMPGFDRSLVQHKTGNYLAPWLAKQQVDPASEAILVNTDGHWLETSTGNLWGWDGNQWYSPGQQNLCGVVRTYLIQWLQSQGKIVDERLWDENTWQKFTHVAYSNSVVQLVPIHTVILTEDDQQSAQFHFSAPTAVLRQAFNENL
jgi:branched-subunit amino acid aminotransferase/4-amino-4-deoxychorismate lyase